MSEAATGFTCQRIGLAYTGREGELQALQDVTFHVRQGEFVCLVGPSGCGKSTLLKLLAGLRQPNTGRLTFYGLPAAGSPPGRAAAAPRIPATGRPSATSRPPATSRPANALVFQEHGLFPWMTIADNVAFGLEAQGVPRDERRRRAREFLDGIGLAGFANSYPHELSVGMRQRAAIARAFLSNPELLLMDEPFSALDAQSKLILQEELLKIWRDHQKMVVYVTHDIEEAVLLGDRVLVMSGRPGRIQEDIPIPLGRPRDLRDRERPEVREITWHIWKKIEEEVRCSLRSPSGD